MKKIAVILLTLFLTACSKEPETEVKPEYDFLVKSEKRIIFDQNTSKTVSTNFTYNEDGFLLSAINEDVSISYLKNEKNLGSLTNAYVVAVENRADAEITRQYFCDENKRVLKETASDGTEKIYSYNGNGFLNRTVIKNGYGIPDDILEYEYNADSEGSQTLKDFILTSFRVQDPHDGSWKVIGKHSSIYYYNMSETSVKGGVVYPFNFGRKRDEQLVKVVKMPFIEGIPEENFYSYTFDKNEYLIGEKVMSNGKYIESVSYSYTSK